MDELDELDRLTAAWRIEEVAVRCSRPSGRRLHDLTKHLRSTVGEALHAIASPEARRGETCSFEPPCAYEWFHADLSGTAAVAAKPYVTRLDTRADDLILAIHLFGEARLWAAELRAAMLMATPRVGGYGLTALEAWRRPVLLPDLPEGPMRLRTVTPIVQRGSKDLSTAALLSGLTERVAVLAQWHGIEWRPTHERLAAEARAAEVQAQVALRDVRARHSRGRDQGWIGQIDLGQPNAWARRLWRIGLATHLGGRVTTGMGRVERAG